MEKTTELVANAFDCAIATMDLFRKESNEYSLAKDRVLGMAIILDYMRQFAHDEYSNCLASITNLEDLGKICNICYGYPEISKDIKEMLNVREE